MAKKLLNIAAILNLVVGGLILMVSALIFNIGWLGFFGSAGIVISLIRLAIGGTFLFIANNKNIENYKILTLIVSIVSILFGHLITFILGIIAFSDIASNNKNDESHIKYELTEEEKTEKRLRSLLALGCGLVLLAGIIFAVTTWETLSGIWKTFALIIASLVFFVISNISEKKFNIKTSSVVYYILANTFSIITFISAGYFEVFGEWFSLNGNGNNLYQAFLWLLTGTLSYLAYLKYEKKNLFYVIFISIFMAIISLVEFMNIGEDVTIAVAAFIVSIFALLPLKGEISKKANNLANVLLALVSFVVFSQIALSKTGDRMIFNVLSFAFVFISSYYLALEKKNEFYSVFSPIFTLVTSFVLISVIGDSSKFSLIQMLLASIIIYVIGYTKRDEKVLFTSTTSIVDIGLLYVLFDAIRLEYNYFAIVAGFTLLTTSILVSISDKFSKYYFETLIEPVKVIALSYTIYKLFDNFEYKENMLFLALVGLVFAVICIFRKDLMKKIYFFGSGLIAIIVMLGSVGKIGLLSQFELNSNGIIDFAPISQGISVIMLTILFAISIKCEEFKNFKEIVYGLGLLSLALVILNTFSHFDLKVIGIIILTAIYSLLFVILRKNDILRCFTVTSLLIPYVVILPISIWNDKINYILYCLPWLALIFIYTRGFLVSVDNKTVNIIEIVALSLWYLVVISKVCLEVAIFIGIISFIAILLGYKSDKWFSLYYTGIVFLILNMLVQLKDFWTNIPVWAYILVAGLSLIGIVTYKEYRKINKVTKVEAEIVSEPNVAVVSGAIDSRTIILGSVLYIVFIPVLMQIIL